MKGRTQNGAKKRSKLLRADWCPPLYLFDVCFYFFDVRFARVDFLAVG